jgi:hypothetical protein
LHIADYQNLLYVCPALHTQRPGFILRFIRAGFFMPAQIPIRGSVPPCKPVMGLLPLRCNATGKAEPYLISACHLNFTEMHYSEEQNLPAAGIGQNPGKRIHDYPAEGLKDSISAGQALNYPVEELIATGEAVFEFIRNSEMELTTKNAFHQLEKQFDFYKNLCQLES